MKNQPQTKTYEKELLLAKSDTEKIKIVLDLLASKEDIDTGMKLGTNYPKGPFEWADEIGLKNIYQTLEAMYEDTKEGRYKICPLLKTEAMA